MTEEAAPKQWWIGAVEKLGLPTVYLALLTLACWRVGVYISTSVVTPVVEAHVKALDAHIEVVKTLAKTIDDARGNARESLTRIEKNTEETLEILKDKQ